MIATKVHPARTRRSICEWLQDYGLDRAGARTDDLVARSAIPGGVSTNPDYSPLAGVPGLRELVTAITRRLVPSQLGALTVPFETPTPVEVGTTATGYWATRGGAKPATAFKATEVNIPPTKAAALTVISKDLLRLGSASDAAIVRLLASSVAARANQTFLSADGAVPETSPAGIAVGAATIAASGDAASDLEALVDLADDADVDLSRAAWVLSPAKAVHIAGSLGIEGLGLRGGELLGAPAVTDRAAGPDVFLVATDRLALAVGALDIRVSEEAAIEMRDDPAGDSTTPTPTTLVALYQTNSVAYLTELFVGWQALTNSTFILTGAAS